MNPVCGTDQDTGGVTAAVEATSCGQGEGQVGRVWLDDLKPGGDIRVDVNPWLPIDRVHAEIKHPRRKEAAVFAGANLLHDIAKGETPLVQVVGLHAEIAMGPTEMVPQETLRPDRPGQCFGGASEQVLRGPCLQFTPVQVPQQLCAQNPQGGKACEAVPGSADRTELPEILLIA